MGTDPISPCSAQPAGKCGPPPSIGCMKAVYLTAAFAPLLAAIIAGLGGRWVSSARAHEVPIFSVLLSFLCSCVMMWDVLQGGTFNGTVYTWLTTGGTGFEIGF